MSEARTQLLWDDRRRTLPRPHDRILDDFQDDLERLGELEPAEFRELLALLGFAAVGGNFKEVTLTVYGERERVLFAATASGWREVPTDEVVEDADDVDVDYQEVLDGDGKDGNRDSGGDGETPRRVAG